MTVNIIRDAIVAKFEDVGGTDVILAAFACTAATVMVLLSMDALGPVGGGG